MEKGLPLILDIFQQTFREYLSLEGSDMKAKFMVIRFLK